MAYLEGLHREVHNISERAIQVQTEGLAGLGHVPLLGFVAGVFGVPGLRLSG